MSTQSISQPAPIQVATVLPTNIFSEQLKAGYWKAHKQWKKDAELLESFTPREMHLKQKALQKKMGESVENLEKYGRELADLPTVFHAQKMAAKRICETNFRKYAPLLVPILERAAEFFGQIEETELEIVTERAEAYKVDPDMGDAILRGLGRLREQMEDGLSKISGLLTKPEGRINNCPSPASLVNLPVKYFNGSERDQEVDDDGTEALLD